MPDMSTEFNFNIEKENIENINDAPTPKAQDNLPQPAHKQPMLPSL